MTIHQLILAGALAAFVWPTASFAQEAKPADAMMSTNADTTGHDTIMLRSTGEMQTASATSTGTTASTANTNTNPQSVQRTIDANPGR